MEQSTDNVKAVQKRYQLPLRPPEQVMDLERLGCHHQTRLSFMRTLMRRVMNEQWRIEPVVFDLNAEAYGTVVYEIQAPGGIYSFVLFSNYLDPENRNDRVIASQWDLTMALCEGQVDAEQLEQLRENVPKQEAGRVDSRVFVLSRANRSARNFESVVDCLASGRQPDPEQIAKVGYLYRTTAVYGSGKLGMADWGKVQRKYPDFARPFAAEMFTCYMLRHFSLLQAEHIARARAPKTVVAMDDRIKRYFGIGNATGLGMAPFLVHHPVLVSQWIEVRETALAKVVQQGAVTPVHLSRLRALTAKVVQHTREITTDNELQSQNNSVLLEELMGFSSWLEQQGDSLTHWGELQETAQAHWGMETQEVINTLLLELYPELVDSLEEQLGAEEVHDIQPEMSLSAFKTLIETHYQWALEIDFSRQEAQQIFWYRSEEKLEPRLGQCDLDPGKDREMPLAVGRAVQQCYEEVVAQLDRRTDLDIAHLLLLAPELKGIVRRIQTMSQRIYGDIQANLVDKDVLPIHLLRCKLAFFGVNKYDPRSRLWVRNTMFQGAPLLSDIGKPFADDWCFPVAPALKEEV